MKTNINIKNDVAVVGAGMTLFRRRLKETSKEIAWGAAKQALDNAGLELSDIDCVVQGSAPDSFDGVHMLAEHTADGAGAILKPMTRVYVGGGTGVFAPISGWWHIASGLCDTVLVVSECKMSPVSPHPQYVFHHMFDPIMEKPLGVNLLWIFALEMHRYMYVYNVRKEDIALVAVKNKRNALDHPAAQVAADLTVEDVLNSEVLVWPIQLLDTTPVSDGAAAIVLSSDKVARKITDIPVWVQGVGWNMDTSYWTNKDLAFAKYLYYAGKMAYKMAGIKNPRKEIDIAEIYDPFDYKELQHMEALQLAKPGEAAILTREGVTQRDGDLPINASGGLLGVGNPISAGSTIKVAEIFWQLRGEAGKRQVQKEVNVGLAQAWGDLMQVGTVMIMSL